MESKATKKYRESRDWESQWLVENFAPFLLGTFHSKQKFKVSRQEAPRNVSYFAV